MARRDLTTFRTVAQEVVRDPSGAATQLASVGQQIIKQSQDAKIAEGLSSATLQINQLNEQFKVDNQSDPFNAETMREYTQARDEILAGVSEGVSPLFRNSFNTQAQRLKSNSDVNIQSWQFKQSRTNTARSLEESAKNYLNQAAFNGQALADKSITPIDLANDLDEAFTSLQTAGTPILGEETTEEALKDFRSKYLDAAIGGVASRNPFEARRLLENEQIKNQMDFDDYQSSVVAVERDITRRRREAAEASYTNALLRVGGPVADPASKRDRKAVDNTYVTSGALERFVAGSPEAFGESVELVRKTSIIPESLQSTLRGYMVNGTDAQRQQAYAFIDQVQISNRGAVQGAGGFTERELRDAAQFNGLVRAGASSEYALRVLREANSPIGAELQSMRQTEAGALLREVEPSDITDLFDPSIFTAEAPFMNRANEDLIMADYKRVLAAEYVRTGNEDAAVAAAKEAVTRFNSVSDVTGTKGLMKYAPEAYAGHEDLTPQENAEWMRRELKADLKPFAAVNRNLDNVSLVATFDSANRVRNNQKPIYNVWFTNSNGEMDLVRDESNEPIVVGFDPQTISNEVREIRDKKVRAALRAAQRKRARTSERRSELEQLELLEPTGIAETAVQIRNYLEDQIIDFESASEERLGDVSPEMLDELERQQRQPFIPGGF